MVTAKTKLYRESPTASSQYTEIKPNLEDIRSALKPSEITINIGGKATATPITEAEIPAEFAIGTLVRPEEDELASLNHELYDSGFFVQVPDNETATIEISYRADGAAATRNVIAAGHNSELNVIERIESTKKSPAFSNALELHLGNCAKVNFMSLQDLGKETDFYCHRRALLGKGSTISWGILNTGARLSKMKRETLLASEGAAAAESELTLSNDLQHSDSHVAVVHAAPKTSSKVSVKGVLAGKSRQVAYGDIRILEEAAGTTSFLEEHSLLLSTEARADSIPALEILTNDVMAKHAATCAQLDEEKIFYIMSRGMSRKEAKRLIVGGFISSAIRLMHKKEPAIARADKWLQQL